MAEIVAQPSLDTHIPLLAGGLKDNGVGSSGFGVLEPMPQFPPHFDDRLFLVTIKGMKVGPAGFSAAAVNMSTNQPGIQRVYFIPANPDPNSNRFIFRPGSEAETWVAEMYIDIDVGGL